MTVTLGDYTCIYIRILLLFKTFFYESNCLSAETTILIYTQYNIIIPPTAYDIIIVFLLVLCNSVSIYIIIIIIHVYRFTMKEATTVGGKNVSVWKLR